MPSSHSNKAPDQLRVAVIQITPTSHKRENLAKAAKLITAAAQDGAKLIALQEMFFYRGSHDDMPGISEPIPGPTSEWLADQAQKHQVWLHGGSLFELNPDDPAHSFNTSLVFNPNGERVGKYRKIHLFELHHGQSVSESDYQCAGQPEDIVTVETPWGGLGMSICFDLRFPELYQHQVRQQKARILSVPSAFLFKTGADHWEVLLRARAIETQCFVLAANCISDEHPVTYGRSMILDPWGNVLARMPDCEGYITADLDFDQQDNIRKKLPVLS